MDFHIPSFVGYLIGFTHLLGLIAAIHALLTVRTAQGSIAWAMPLIFIPYVTLIPYLVFGRSTFDGYINARRQANQEMRTAIGTLNWRPWIEEAVTARRSEAYASLRAMPRLGRMPCLANNEVTLLINGEATFAAIFEAIRGAKKAVLIQFFIIHDDELGRRLQALLLEKAAEGVAIYVLYDRVGSHALSASYSETLRNGGVQIKAFATRSGWLNRFQINFRNHRKIVVVDGVRGFVGGHNVGDEYLGKLPPLSPWRDTHVAIVGPVVACLQESFAEDWFWATRELPQLILPESYPEDGVLCQLLASGPADAQETCSLFFVEAIHAAQNRVWITSPYFIPDEAVFAALRLAVLRGVDVRILLPSRPDHYVVYAASSLFAFEAVRAGVRIFRYEPGFMHQKVVLVDSEISAIGSANMDNRSFRLNFELMLLTVDSDFASQVEVMLNADFALAREIALEESKETHRFQQLGMRIARLVSPIL
ncbi:MULTISPECIES: cardiolipin synthase [unclassified Pseudomonas]|uniref:cardiolipin synthase n=1 Tax=unclassified Pseudomonas TaxID=196821 RepID=UPI002AC89F5F|nr:MULTISPECIES: cardiolipin synthase [unclassified Pseudomonas]MEB0043440.1 cardiolipin synthase [Pseudomonas sp. MH10]MEB0079687.1 cardiolipin synthase [Pseudomonas sp. MH10out]MEB0103441.1 cardiolipin synthase [Pseudomonas sp. CCI3.2]MEB0132206.1 cardiolipin synthase [Pseudomonas sp. CCI2.4]MEB0157832.1 cardiolipin synthase [Pseudomonas sp. AH2 (2023)]